MGTIRLTYQAPKYSKGDVANVASPEIEITSEMIEAGLDEYAGYNHDFEGPRSMLIRVYRAMASASTRRFSS
jgi:hypothetical protein